MSGYYTGCVESREDPLKLGRCKVRIVGLHTEDKVKLPTDDLPWAYPMQPITSAAISGIGYSPTGIVTGTWVIIIFRDKYQQLPIMIGTVGGIPNGSPDIDGVTLSSGNLNVFDTKVPDPIGDGSSILGPLAKLIAKGESGAEGYNAYNRGTLDGRVLGSNGKRNLVGMPIKEIMGFQTLSISDPQRLFAVGRFQCIPSTLSSAVRALNLDASLNFSERVQDIICQEYLLAKKRPALVTYYNNPDKNNNDLLVKCGESLAAEFASIESPITPGYPYGGANGRYARSGNHLAVRYESQLKPTLIAEWEFRNSGKVSTPTSTTSSDNLTGFNLPNLYVISPGGVDFIKGFESTDVSKFITKESIETNSGSIVKDKIKVLLSQPMYDALCSFATSYSALPLEIISELNSSRYESAAELIVTFNKTNGVEDPYLNDRRLKEKTLFLSGGLPNTSLTEQVNVNSSSTGFSDPNGQYPLYKSEPDTNRLAINSNISQTVVIKKEAALDTAIPIANGGSWDQSPIPYNTLYPYNHVYQSESGHLLEFDDSPGSERVHLYHKSGTFTEIDANGTQVTRIIGDSYEILERNGYIHIKGVSNVTVDGAHNLKVSGVLNLEVSGATNINIYNDANINVSGSTNLAVAGEFNVKANGINLESTSDINIKSSGSTNIQSESALNIKSNTELNIQSIADFSINSNANLFCHSVGEIDLLSGAINIEGSNVNVLSSGATNISSAGLLNLYGGSMLTSHFPIPTGASIASGASSGSSASDAIPTDLQIPSDTREANTPSFTPLTVIRRGGEVGFDSPDSGDSSNYASDRIQNNEVNRGELADPKTIISRDRVENANTPSKFPVTVASCNLIYNKNASEFNADTKLSEYYTLGDLTKNGVRIPRVSYTVKGVTYTPQQIICNLKGLCENVLDILAKKYGKSSFIITSAFRRPPIGNTPGDLGIGSNGIVHQEGGDHPIGCAVDITFLAGKVKTYEVAKELPVILPAWSQIIMEYDGHSSWIHISYKYIGNKGDYFTMNHHQIYGGTYPRGGFILI